MDIETLQSLLGAQLPADVAAQLAKEDGLQGPTGCPLLYSAKEMLRRNRLLKAEEWYPPSLRRLVLLGDDGCGNLIAYDTESAEGVLWNPADGTWIQQRRKSVDEIWQFVKQIYANDA